MLWVLDSSLNLYWSLFSLLKKLWALFLKFFGLRWALHSRSFFAARWFLGSIKPRLWHFPEKRKARPCQSWAPQQGTLSKSFATLVLFAFSELLGPWEYFLDRQRLSSRNGNSRQQDVPIMYGMTNISSHVDPKGS